MDYDFKAEDFEVITRSTENQLLESFSDEFLSGAFRILSTNIILPNDTILVKEALAILVSMYMQRLNDGELNQNRTLN